VRVDLLAMTVLAALAVGAAPARAAPGHRPGLDQLLKQFNSSAPQPAGKVRLDAWIERGERGSEMVILVEPEGRTKLIADPGITVTPTERPGLEWQAALPYRYQNPDIDYFSGPATVRLPFAAEDHQPIQVLVEYAYCVVDYQCFLGEETLTVANQVD
jgi:hypothetical protein